MTTEALLEELELAAELELSHAYNKVAQAYLAAFRAMLKPYNLKRHPVKVVRRGGYCTLQVGEHLVWYYRHNRPLLDLIHAIGAEIEKAEKTWAPCLIEVEL